MTTYYKIRRKSNPEMFVKGTPYYLSHDKTGRIFQKLGQLRTFLTGVINANRTSNMDDWEIVELEMVVKDVKGVHELIKPEKLVDLLKR